MIAELERDELLDWLALWEVDPWGPDREDMRAAVLSFWNRGGSMSDIGMRYPYTDSDDGCDEDIEAILEQEAAEIENGSRTGTAKS